MINIPITKILFLDIETVGGCKDYNTCKDNSPKIAVTKNAQIVNGILHIVIPCVLILRTVVM